MAAWVLAIWSAQVYAAHRAAGKRRSYWSQFMHAEPFLDTRPMSFAEVLGIYSLRHAAWRARRDRRGRGAGS